jgi:phosphohistidine phosphatase
MQVILIRHAEAIDETRELRDPYRHLTPLGRIQARNLGDRLRWHDCAATCAWTSPLVRAVQTTELVVAGLDASIPIEVVPALAPGESTRAMIEALRAMAPESCVLVIGHEPVLSAMAATLTASSDFPALAKAEAVRIVDGHLRWRFVWNAETPTVA